MGFSAALSVPAAGLVLAAQPLGTMIAAPIAGRLAGHVPSQRMILYGSLLAAAGGWNAVFNAA